MLLSFARTTITAAVLTASSTLAFSAADDAIKARQACMKANGGIMGVAVPVMKAEKPYDAAALQDAIGKMEAACGSWATFWVLIRKKARRLKPGPRPKSGLMLRASKLLVAHPTQPCRR